jgi:hypothetical protein
MSKEAWFIGMNGTPMPAEIEHIWNEITGEANLRVGPVQYEGKGDADYYFPVTDIPYSSESKPRTWHWIKFSSVA